MPRKRKLTIFEQRELMAANGDVDGLYKLLLNADSSMISWEEVFKQLLRAIEICCRRDPATFAAEMFARMFSLSSFLVMRGHFHATKLIAMHDRSNRGRGSAELPRELTELVLPRLIELQSHLAEIAHAQASVCRLWELAKGKRLDNQRAAIPWSGSADEPTPAGTPADEVSGSADPCVPNELSEEGRNREQQTRQEDCGGGRCSTDSQGITGGEVVTDCPED